MLRPIVLIHMLANTLTRLPTTEFLTCSGIDPEDVKGGGGEAVVYWTVVQQISQLDVIVKLILNTN